MPLEEHLIEVTAKHQIACKGCHAIADIAVSNPPVLLVCPSCHLTLGHWETMPQSIADITAFVSRG